MTRPYLTLSDVSLANKRVFVRADFNVPMNDGIITDDTRIRATLPGLRQCLAAGAAVCVTSHLGRPGEGRVRKEDSLAPVAERLTALLGQTVRLQADWTDGDFEMPPGSLTVLENCRCNVGEKSNDPALAKRIASWIDIYVNEAFGTAHRRECTLHALALAAPQACAGPLLTAELDALAQALAKPARPLIAIVGGSKVSSKLSVLENLAEKVDALIVGGGIANTFLAAKGHPIGKSLYEPDLLKAARSVAASLSLRNKTLWLPCDLLVAKRFASDAEASVKTLDEVADDDIILDIGPKSRISLESLLRQAGTIVWNGPLGVFEMPRFAAGTRALAEVIASSPGYSIAGGGDTLAAIAQFGVTDRIDYISTGGGAFLEYLEGRELPALAALLARGKAATASPAPEPANSH